MGVGSGLYMYDVVVKIFTFAISSHGQFLVCVHLCCFRVGWLGYFQNFQPSVRSVVEKISVKALVPY